MVEAIIDDNGLFDFASFLKVSKTTLAKKIMSMRTKAMEIGRRNETWILLCGSQIGKTHPKSEKIENAIFSVAKLRLIDVFEFGQDLAGTYIDLNLDLCTNHCLWDYVESPMINWTATPLQSKGFMNTEMSFLVWISYSYLFNPIIPSNSIRR